MPFWTWDFLTSDEHTRYGDGVIIRGVAKLRKTDDDGNYSRVGTYGSGEIESPVFSASSIDSLFGFEYDGDLNGGSISFRLSPDGGTTYLWWDGAAWSAATLSNEWNTKAEVEENISSFPILQSRSLRVMMRLEGSSDGSETPQVSEVYTYFESAYYEFGEDVALSVRKKLSDEVDSLARERAKLSAASATHELRTKFASVLSLVSAFNLTDDPNRETNIGQSVTGTTVTFTGVQAAGSDIEINFRVGIEITLASDPTYVDGSSPVIAVERPSQNEMRDQRIMHRFSEPNKQLGIGKKRFAPTREEVSVFIRCAGPYERECAWMAQAVQRAMKFAQFVRSLAMGEKYYITDLSPVAQVTDFSEERHELTVSATISGRDWTRPDYEELPLAERITLRTGGLSVIPEEDVIDEGS